MNKKTTTLSIFLVILLAIVATWIYLGFFKKTVNLPIDTQTTPKEKLTHGECLEESEFVEYKLKKELTGSGMVEIIVKSRITEGKKFNFFIEDINSEHYYPLAIHKCGIYVTKYVNWDPKKTIQLPGFKKELWRYGYDKNYKKLIVYSEDGNQGD